MKLIVYFLIASLLFLSGCKTPQVADPIVVTKEVLVPIAVECIPANYDHTPPTYADSKEALLAASDAAERYQLLWAGRFMREAQESLYRVVIEGCMK